MRRHAPNLITWFRVILVPLFALSFALPGRWDESMPFILFALGGVSDMLDGYAARRLDAQSSFGAFLDPLADKLMVGVALLLIANEGMLSAQGIGAAVMILFRELFVAGLRDYLARMGQSLPVSSLAKAKTFLQMLAIALILVPYAWLSALGLDARQAAMMQLGGIALLWIAAVFSVATGIHYLSKAWPQLVRPS